jgi:hypothetical protein
MAFLNFTRIVEEAWANYDDSRQLKKIEDISAKVSTNHVYKVTLEDRTFVIAKLSYFGQFEHFVEDHSIINSMSNNLPAPYENFLSRSLMKGTSIFVHRHQSEIIDAWVIFYRPVKIKQKLPRRLDDRQIEKLAVEAAHFHRACHTIRHTLPTYSKSLASDVHHLVGLLDTKVGGYDHRMMEGTIRQQSELFLNNIENLDFPAIPVFVDWNIGNFSITPYFRFFSRWDYDWFRMSTRMMDFYFFSRVVSDIGDRTVFSYWITTLQEDRFIRFLRAYHQVFPLTATEIRFLKEAYRFFILNYVIKDGRYFFHEIFASKLQHEAYEHYLPSIADFPTEKLLKALDLTD